MSAGVRRAGSALTLIVFASVANAQWDPYPSPGVPLDANGEPDLMGPTPRTFDGRFEFAADVFEFGGERFR